MTEGEIMLGELWEQLLERTDFDAEDIHHDLSHEERVFMLTYWHYLDTGNGGESQFISNTGGDKYEETITAMDEIGALQTAEYMRTIARIFRDESGQQFSTDQIERQKQIDKYGWGDFTDLCERESEKHRQSPEFIPDETVKRLIVYVEHHREA